MKFSLSLSFDGDHYSSTGFVGEFDELNVSWNSRLCGNTRLSLLNFCVCCAILFYGSTPQRRFVRPLCVVFWQ